MANILARNIKNMKNNLYKRNYVDYNFGFICCVGLGAYTAISITELLTNSKIKTNKIYNKFNSVINKNTSKIYNKNYLTTITLDGIPVMYKQELICEPDQIYLNKQQDNANFIRELGTKYTRELISKKSFKELFLYEWKFDEELLNKINICDHLIKFDSFKIEKINPTHEFTLKLIKQSQTDTTFNKSAFEKAQQNEVER